MISALKEHDGKASSKRIMGVLSGLLCMAILFIQVWTGKSVDFMMWASMLGYSALNLGLPKFIDFLNNLTLKK